MDNKAGATCESGPERGIYAVRYPVERRDATLPSIDGDLGHESNDRSVLGETRFSRA